MEDKVILYRCDPLKNTECRKTMCFINGKMGHECRATTRREFSARDENGNPVVERVLRGDRDGTD